MTPVRSFIKNHISKKSRRKKHLCYFFMKNINRPQILSIDCVQLCSSCFHSATYTWSLLILSFHQKMHTGNFHCFSQCACKECCIGVRIDWLLKGASKVQIHDQNISQSLIFKAFHHSVGSVPWQMNSILIIGIIAPYMYSFLRFFNIDAKVQTGCKITTQAPSKPVSTRFPELSRWSAPADEKYFYHFVYSLFQ